MSGTVETAPVAVVGGGPVGLAAALALAVDGVAVIVVESGNGDVGAQWRGSTLHPPTLAMLDHLGLASVAVSDGVRVDRLQYRDLETDRIAEFDYHLLDGTVRYPFRIQYEQYKLLRRLREAAAAHPAVDLRFGHRVTAVEPDSTRTVLTVEDRAGATSRIGARWVVGADGAHSTVRHALGIEFPGETYPTLSLVAATRFGLAEAVRDLGAVSYWTGPTGRVSLIRTPDTWRVALSTDVAAGDAKADGTAAEPHPRLVDALDRLVGSRRWADVPLGQHQLYRSHQRVAARFRHDRVVLIGDAAHLSSTTGGMGLNSGIHDAFDLARRIADPLRRADDDGAARAAGEYATRRRQVATKIVQPATRAVRDAVDETDAAVRAARLGQLCRMAADPARAARHLREVSMLDAVEAVAGP